MADDDLPDGFDAGRDLWISRRLDAPRKLVWEAWSHPEHLQTWWAPPPLTTPICEMDFRPGGVFRTVMRDPDGAEYGGEGCFVDLVPQSRIVFTDALGPGWRPVASPFMTVVITMADEGNGTRYGAHILHADEDARIKHEEMGFHTGWGSVINQLGEFAKKLSGSAS